MLLKSLLPQSLLCLFFVCALTACANPSGTDAPASQESTETTPSTSTSLAVAVPRSELNREEFARAMACAADKAAPGSKFRFKSQLAAFDGADSEDAFNNAIAASGGDAKYILYTQAISLGCAK